MVRLVWKQRGGEGKTFPVGESVTLGRESSLDCVLDVRSVSRRHARIERRGDAFFISDLGSTNGTVVNGVRIVRPTHLAGGETIQLGDEVLEFKLEDPTTRGESAGGQPTLETAPLDRRPNLQKTGNGGKPAEVLPRRSGKHYLLRKLGHGGMGTVYHAIDLDSNREVAIKYIRPTLGRNEAFLDFFHNREAVLAREIDHPNVIRVFEHGVDHEQHYICMELVSGRNLFSLLKERRLKPSEALRIVKQVACGLVAAHRQGVVHSDIKPANVLLREEPSAGGSTPAAGAADDDDSALILELHTDAEPSRPERPATQKYDTSLQEEIRRRVGEPSRDVLLDPPFFPRQSELSFLGHYFERATEGHGNLLLVEGEVGTGRNRLLSEFLRTKGLAPSVAGRRALEGACRFLELDCARIEGLPLLHEQLFGSRPSESLTARQLGEGIVQQLLAEPGTTVIRLLNLGGATPAICDLLGGLGPVLARKGLLLVGAVATGETRANGGLKQLLERLGSHVKELYLRPLTEYQVQRFLQTLFRDALAHQDLTTHLHRLSLGNFASLIEVLRGFFERGILSVDRPSGRLIYRPRQYDFELAEGKGLYEKYRSYGKIEQHVLELAAFVGPRFAFDTLLKLHDINETSLFFIVRTLLNDGFFTEEGRTWYSFTNVAFQRYMAERIPTEDRPHLHRKLTRLLQMPAVPESPELQQLRARHLAGCHEYARAVVALLEGAHLARCEYQVDTAREMIQEILRIYRLLARREGVRKEVTGILRDWFRRDGNWYEILGELASEQPVATVKIADFGISFRVTDEERGYNLEKRPALGTPRYMAPERGGGEYGGFKSDVFSLGIILHEMAVGAPPFPELKGNDVIQANRELKISLPAEVLRQFPPGTEALFAGMVEKDPRKRWDAERVLREISKLELELGER